MVEAGPLARRRRPPREPARHAERGLLCSWVWCVTCDPRPTSESLAREAARTASRPRAHAQMLATTATLKIQPAPSGSSPPRGLGIRLSSDEPSDLSYSRSRSRRRSSGVGAAESFVEPEPPAGTSSQDRWARTLNDKLGADRRSLKRASGLGMLSRQTSLSSSKSRSRGSMASFMGAGSTTGGSHPHSLKRVAGSKSSIHASASILDRVMVSTGQSPHILSLSITPGGMRRSRGVE